MSAVFNAVEAQFVPLTESRLDEVLAIECSTGVTETLAPQSGLSFRKAHLDSVARVLGVSAGRAE